MRVAQCRFVSATHKTKISKQIDKDDIRLAKFLFTGLAAKQRDRLRLRAVHAQPVQRPQHLLTTCPNQISSKSSGSEQPEHRESLEVERTPVLERTLARPTYGATTPSICSVSRDKAESIDKFISEFGENF